LGLVKELHNSHIPQQNIKRYCLDMPPSVELLLHKHHTECHPTMGTQSQILPAEREIVTIVVCLESVGKSLTQHKDVEMTWVTIMLPKSLKQKPLLDKQPTQLLFQSSKNVFSPILLEHFLLKSLAQPFCVCL
jgi:hypothetical protein